jgi:hypothetical protein
MSERDDDDWLYGDKEEENNQKLQKIETQYVIATNYPKYCC